jgi:hypothetical protein
MVLQYAHEIFILKHVVIGGEGFFRLNIILKVFPFIYLICFS